jgi:hypothetical protein
MSDRLSLSQVAALMAYAATTAGGKTPALRGAGDGPLAERIAGFLLNGYFFVRSVSSPGCPFCGSDAWLPRFCRTVAIRLVIDIVLIWCGLFFIAG